MSWGSNFPGGENTKCIALRKDVLPGLSEEQHGTVLGAGRKVKGEIDQRAVREADPMGLRRYKYMHSTFSVMRIFGEAGAWIYTLTGLFQKMHRDFISLSQEKKWGSKCWTYYNLSDDITLSQSCGSEVVNGQFLNIFLGLSCVKFVDGYSMRKMEN